MTLDQYIEQRINDLFLELAAEIDEGHVEITEEESNRLYIQ